MSQVKEAIGILKVARYQVGMNTTRVFIDQALAKLCTKQPPASEFTKECRELRKRGATDEQWEYATRLSEACKIIDTATQRADNEKEIARKALEACVLANIEIKQLEAKLKDLLAALEKMLSEIELAALEKMLSEIEDNNYARYGVDPGAYDESEGAKLGRAAIAKAKQS